MHDVVIVSSNGMTLGKNKKRVGGIVNLKNESKGGNQMSEGRHFIDITEGENDVNCDGRFVLIDGVISIEGCEVWVDAIARGDER